MQKIEKPDSQALARVVICTDVVQLIDETGRRVFDALGRYANGECVTLDDGKPRYHTKGPDDDDPNPRAGDIYIQQLPDRYDGVLSTHVSICDDPARGTKTPSNATE